MRVCVVGCRTIGSLFAGHLAQVDDLEVWAYDLAGRRDQQGWPADPRVSELVAEVRAAADAGQLPAYEYGIVATKSMHTASVIEATAAAIR